MELFILRMTPYREKDYIITALSSESVVSFKAVGLAKPTAKLAGIVTLYALIEAELDERKSGLVLTHAKAISKNYKLMNDYHKLSVLNFIGEICLRILRDSEEVERAYPFVREALLGLERGFEPLTLAYLVLAKVLQASGYGLDVKRCVYCRGQTDIVGVNYIQGGLVCRQHLGHDHDIAMDTTSLNIVRYAFLVPFEKFLTMEFENASLKSLFEQLVVYFEDALSITLKSCPVIKKSFF